MGCCRGSGAESRRWTWDSSIHEVYGEKKEGADWAYNNTWSYGVLYGTLAETGDLLHVGLREGFRHTSYGDQGSAAGNDRAGAAALPGVAGARGQRLLQSGVGGTSASSGRWEYFIVAKQHRNLMNAVRGIPEAEWKSYDNKELQEDGRSRRRRRRRDNLKRKIGLRRKPNSRFKGAPEVATMMFQPKSWKKARRYVIKRTPIVDKDDRQLYLDDGMRRWAYWIVVTNSKTAQRAGVADRAGAAATRRT